MRPGRMDRRATLQHKYVLTNSYGEPIVTWTTYATVWAEKREMRGVERYAAKQVEAEVESIFKIWYRTDIKVEDALICDGKTYDITAMLDIGRHEGLELYATARAE